MCCDPERLKNVVEHLTKKFHKEKDTVIAKLAEFETRKPNSGKNKVTMGELQNSPVNSVDFAKKEVESKHLTFEEEKIQQGKELLTQLLQHYDANLIYLKVLNSLLEMGFLPKSIHKNQADNELFLILTKNEVEIKIGTTTEIAEHLCYKELVTQTS